VSFECQMVHGEEFIGFYTRRYFQAAFTGLMIWKITWWIGIMALDTLRYPGDVSSNLYLVFLRFK